MKRVLALGAGLFLAGAGAYVVVGEQMAGVTADAVVNAQVLTVRAPVDGAFDLQVRRLGTRLTEGQRLGSLSDPRPDDTRLIDLQRTLASLEADQARFEDLTRTVVTSRDAYERQSQDYAAGRVSQLEARLAEATASNAAAEARLREADASLRRANELARSGIQTAAELNRLRTLFEVASQEIEATRNRVQFLTIELAAARRGVFLGDSFNDAPSSQQRVRELDQRIGEIAAEVRERARRISLVQSQIAEERARLALFSEASLTSPAPAILWEVMTANREYVRRAQDLVRLVDCTTTVVTASVRESVYNRLRVGDTAQFRLLGDGRVFDAVVTRLAGSGAVTIYRHLAVGPSEEHLKRYDVTLTVPGLADDPELNCAVGRTGRAVFTARPLDWWRSLF